MTRLGTPLKWTRTGTALKPLCRKIGVPAGTAGVNEKVIQKEIGHSTLRLTRRYTHFSPEQRRATAEKWRANR